MNWASVRRDVCFFVHCCCCCWLFHFCQPFKTHYAEAFFLFFFALWLRFCRLIVWRNFSQRPNKRKPTPCIDLCNTNLIRNLLHNGLYRWEYSDKWTQVLLGCCLYLFLFFSRFFCCLLFSASVRNWSHDHQKVPQSVRKSDKYEQWTSSCQSWTISSFPHIYTSAHNTIQADSSIRRTNRQWSSNFMVFVCVCLRWMVNVCKFEHFIHHSTAKLLLSLLN